MTKVEWTEKAIALLKEVNTILEDELEYSWVVTDGVTDIVESLEHDLGELMEGEG